MDHKLITFLQESGTLITPSRRLASSLLKQANHYYWQNSVVWLTPRIYALQDWLLAIWEQLEIQGSINKQLLTPAQSLLLWGSVIRSLPVGKSLLNVSATAKMANQAWSLLHQWLIQDSWYQESVNVDQQTFHEFAAHYQQWLTEHQAIDGAQLMGTLQTYLTSFHQAAWQRVSPVNQLTFYGFEESYPLLEQLKGVLIQQGWQVNHGSPTQKNPSFLGRVAFHDQQQELLTAALFAKQKLAEGKKNIGIVVPDLANMRMQVDKTMKEIFEPLTLCEPQAKVSEFYNISAATPLDHYPIIYSAFCWLKILKGTFSLSDYFQIIHSPFFAWNANELTLLLQQYESLLKNNQQKLTLNKLSKTMVDSTWLEIIHNIEAYLGSLPNKLPYAQWAKHFQQLLILSGWPGLNALNSVEHQVVNRWQEALAECRMVDSIQEPVSYHEALSTLRGIVAQIPFQAQSKGANVQILGILEALGLQFDCLWVLGLHSEAWPPLAKPNPLLPLALQRQLKMPHASSEREMAYAKTMTERLCTSANEVILSYPKADKAKILEGSELIRHIPLLPDNHFQALGEFTRLEEQFKLNQALETIIDNQAPPLLPTEKIAATSQLLSLQAACPFKAFAEIRLQAKRLEKMEDWLASFEQGIILHEVLQHFWQEVSTQQALLAMTQEALSHKLVQLIDQALYRYIKPNTPAPYLKVEKNRLLIILHDYLALEKERQPFKIVAVEWQKNYELLDMTFRLRIDRIDKTELNETILIDYKSGQFQITQIWGDRPKAPQLPLYYLAMIAEQPQALCVAKLNRQTDGYEGISRHSLAIKGIKELTFMPWEELESYWSGTLSALVASFKRGDAMASPLEGTATCRYCALTAFCRINEQENDDN